MYSRHQFRPIRLPFLSRRTTTHLIDLASFEDGNPFAGVGQQVVEGDGQLRIRRRVLRLTSIDCLFLLLGEWSVVILAGVIEDVSSAQDILPSRKSAASLVCTTRPHPEHLYWLTMPKGFWGFTSLNECPEHRITLTIRTRRRSGLREEEVLDFRQEPRSPAPR